MDYFAGLDISMDETHICVVDRDGAVVYEGKSASTAEAIADKLSEAPGCHRIVFETGRMGADPVPWVEPTRPPSGLCREPAGVSGAQVARDPQDRPQRRARAGAFGSHRVLQARAREVSVGPRRPLADHRAQEAGRTARDLGKSDPWSRGRVRGPTAPRAHRRLHRQRS